MKITKRQLRRILTEEPHDWYKDMKSGSITYADYKRMVADWEEEQQGYRQPSRRKTTFVGTDANSAQIAAVEALKPKSQSFLGSILQQLKNGRGLSSKQKAVVKKIMRKRDPASESLFESNKMKITKRQLKTIIKEAIRDAFEPGEESINAGQLGFNDAVTGLPEKSEEELAALGYNHPVDYDAYSDGFEQGIHEKGFYQ